MPILPEKPIGELRGQRRTGTAAGDAQGLDAAAIGIQVRGQDAPAVPVRAPHHHGVLANLGDKELKPGTPLPKPQPVFPRYVEEAEE